MITLKLQITLIVSSLFFTAIVVNMIRNESIELKYSLTWLLSAIILVILPFCPRVLDVVAGFFGIYSPVNILFLVGILFLIIITFSLTVVLSRCSNKIKNLTQEIALLKLEIERTEQKNEHKVDF